ncbi:hypothetical protein EYR38_003336 [Pleurotus pulmonarius]|nr:hypothetical protein EYR38_003336 [Pleurotus pulmonarius]
MQNMRYIASATILSDCDWKKSLNEDVWAYQGDAVGPALLHIVGRISDEALHMGRMGTYKYDLNNMLTAAWVFQLQQPNESVFDADYRRGLSILNILQNSISRSNKNTGMLVEDDNESAILFSAPLFVKRNSSSKDPQVEDWPVGYASSERFQNAQTTHCFEPLKVTSRNGVPIPEMEWESTVSGALVEVTFTVHHSHAGAGKCDIFKAKPSKIKVVKPNEAKKVQKQSRVKVVDKVASGPMDTWLNHSKGSAIMPDVIDVDEIDG